MLSLDMIVITCGKLHKTRIDIWMAWLSMPVSDAGEKRWEKIGLTPLDTLLACGHSDRFRTTIIFFLRCLFSYHFQSISS